MILVLANGFFVATEFSLVSVRRTRIQHLASEGDRRARGVLDLLNHLDTYIAATQLGITISSIGLGWIGEPAIARLLEPGFQQLTFIPENWRDNASHTVSFIIAFSIVTTLHIVFGELAPKSIALQRPEATALSVSRPIHWFLILFRPIINALNGVGNAVVRLAGIEPAAGHALVQSAEELKLSVDASRAAGLVHQTAHDLVDRAFSFTDLQARHVMVPRTEVTAVPVNAKLDDIFRLAATSSHVRLPVFDGDNDHIVGIVNIKRLLPLIYTSANGTEDPAALSGAIGTAGSDFDVRDYMVDPLAIPETVPASDVLSRLREERTQIAIVIDEYGGTAGIVTLEDLVESLVGEIEEDQEGDSHEPEEQFAADGSLILDGLTTLGEARERFDLDLREDEVDVETVGGYVFATLGRPAQVGDEVTGPGGEVLRVEEVDGLRVARVRVFPAAPASSVAESEPADLAGAATTSGTPH